LFISKELVTLQGGRIWVASEPGQGATFSFTIPIFSLRRVCAPVLSARHLQGGWLSVIAVTTFHSRDADEVTMHRLQETRTLLEGSILAGQDLIVPRMFGPQSSEPLFVLAGTDGAGAAAIVRRIQRLLANDSAEARACRPPLLSTTLIEYPTPAQSGYENAVVFVVDRLTELMAAATEEAEANRDC
jgi:hypothetical protein